MKPSQQAYDQAIEFGWVDEKGLVTQEGHIRCHSLLHNNPGLHFLVYTNIMTFLLECVADVKHPLGQAVREIIEEGEPNAN